MSHMTAKPRKPIRRKPRVFPPLPFGSRWTEEELQAIVRGNPKPKPGTARASQRARARLAKTRERAAKDAAKARDNYSCRRCHGLIYSYKVEAAHIRSAGMGGDPTGLRGWKASDYVTLCHSCHQGPRSVHSGHVVMVVGPKGGDGPVSFVGGTPGGRA